MKTRGTKWILVGTLLGALAPSLSHAAGADKPGRDGSGDSRGGPPSEAEVGRRMEMMRMWGLSRELDLTDDELAKLMPIMNRYAHERESLQKEQRAAFDALNRLVGGAESAKTNPSDADVKSATDRMVQVEQRMSETRRREFEEVTKVLSPKRAAQYLLFHVRFANRMRHVAGEAIGRHGSMEGRDGRGGDGGMHHRRHGGGADGDHDDGDSEGGGPRGNGPDGDSPDDR